MTLYYNGNYTRISRPRQSASGKASSRRATRQPPSSLRLHVSYLKRRFRKRVGLNRAVFLCGNGSFNLQPGASLGDVTSRIQALATRELPDTIATQFQGAAAAFENSLGNLWVLLIIASRWFTAKRPRQAHNQP